MISRTRIPLVSFLVLSVTCRIALGSEPNDANEPLRFETSSIRLPLPGSFGDKPEDQRLAYAAGIVPEGSVEFFAWPRGQRVDSFVGRASMDKEISLRQKEFLQDTEGLLTAWIARSHSSIRRTTRTIRRFCSTR